VRGHALRAAALALTLNACAGGAHAVDRVPRPEFDSQYRPPSALTPAAPSVLPAEVDVLGRGGVLLVGAHPAVMRR
jgi:hypothetical protein